MNKYEMKEYLKKAWKEIFPESEAGEDADFFADGGDSIKAVQLTAWLLQKGIKLDMIKIYTEPVLGQLAETLEETQPMYIPKEALTKEILQNQFGIDPALVSAYPQTEKKEQTGFSRPHPAPLKPPVKPQTPPVNPNGAAPAPGPNQDQQMCTPNQDRQMYTPNQDRQMCTPNQDRQMYTPNQDRQMYTPNQDRQMCTPNQDRQLCTPPAQNPAPVPMGYPVAAPLQPMMPMMPMMPFMISVIPVMPVMIPMTPPASPAMLMTQQSGPGRFHGPHMMGRPFGSFPPFNPEMMKKLGEYQPHPLGEPVENPNVMEIHEPEMGEVNMSAEDALDLVLKNILPTFDRSKSLFDQGFTSLNLMQIVTRCGEQGYRLNMKDIIDAPYFDNMVANMQPGDQA